MCFTLRLLRFTPAQRRVTSFLIQSQYLVNNTRTHFGLGIGDSSQHIDNYTFIQHLIGENQSVQQYNSMIRTFPNNLTAKMFGYQVKPNFTVENEKAISTAPTVDFGTQAPAPAGSAAH